MFLETILQKICLYHLGVTEFVLIHQKSKENSIINVHKDLKTGLDVNSSLLYICFSVYFRIRRIKEQKYKKKPSLRPLFTDFATRENDECRKIGN